MQAIILAAGMGNRLKELTASKTKCMVEVNGETLIKRLLGQITSKPLDRIIIVLGHKGEKLKKFIGDNHNGIKIEYLTNIDYDKTNNIYSLYIAKNKFACDDTILFESDLIFDDSIVDFVFDSIADQSFALIDEYQSWMDGTLVNTDNDDQITKFIEKIDFNYNATKQYYKTINLYFFTKEFTNKFYIPF